METSNQESHEIFRRIISAKRKEECPEYSLEIIYESWKAKTQYYHPPICVVRRGTFMVFKFQTNDVNFNLDKIGLQLVTRSKNAEKKINLSSGMHYDVYFHCVNERKSNDTVWITLKTTTLSPVGLYEISVTDGDMLFTEYIPVFLIFNPFDPLDTVYCEDNTTLNDYLFHPSTKTHYGNAKSYKHRSYKLEQFSLECVSVANIYLSGLSLKQRTSPVHVSRQIAAFVNNTDSKGLISENRGRITSGRIPSSWINMKDIYTEYLKTLEPVKWGQCLIFSALVTSLCRNIGIACRSVTGFSICPDEYSCEYMTIYLFEENLETVDNSECPLNFHCWNNIWLKRNDIWASVPNIKCEFNGWQHLDGTPHKKKQVIFPRGPFPISLLKSHIYNDEIPYDGSSIYRSLYDPIKYLIVGEDRADVKIIMKNFDKCILTSSRYKSSIKITNEYMDMILKQKTINPNKLNAKLTVKKSIRIGKPLNYEVKILNATGYSETVVNLTIELRDLYGINIFTKNPEKSIVLVDKNTTINGEFLLDINSIFFDVSLCSLYWVLKIFDTSIDKAKIIQKTSIIRPLFAGSVQQTNLNSECDDCKISIIVTNKTNLKLDGTKISAIIKHIDTTLNEETVDLEAFERKELSFELKNIPIGYRKIFVCAIYGACYQEIGSINYLAKY